uniref:beta-glucosidase n=1 Tax=Chrysomela lapponica TaxID=153811 RepID=A0A0B5EF77_CHRLA|nr:putative glycosyl hydrolase [Chrysomela lapponica]
MISFLKFTVLVTLVTRSLADDYVLNNKRFPSDFIFGVATSAYQIEGAWNEDGKTMSTWDNLTHARPELIVDGRNADVACDSYHRYEEDVALMKEVGVNHYRLSLSWSRILPTGFSDQINQPGVDYYKSLFRALKANGIEPIVTVYHLELPLALQELNGVLNESFIDWYADYAAVCFELFGDDVKLWTTFNEPKQICTGGYGYAYFFPYIHSEGLLEYQCAHNVLRAHAKAYRIYDERFRASQGGKVSIVLDAYSYLPASDSAADITAAETRMQFDLGWYANPIFNGDYPEIMKSRIANRSKGEGRDVSRLPEFTDEEKIALNGSADFFGLNVYTAALVAAMDDPPISNPPSKYQDMGVNDYQPSDWETTSLDWLKVAPWTIRHLLNWINDHYHQPDIIVTENGVCDNTGTFQDTQRVSYIQRYLSNIRDTMEQDGVNVIGYIVWSIMDNFEWAQGYTQRFGLHHVDFDSPNRTRTPKQSAQYYKNVCETKCLVDDDFECID